MKCTCVILQTEDMKLQTFGRIGAKLTTVGPLPLLKSPMYITWKEISSILKVSQAKAFVKTC